MSKQLAAVVGANAHATKPQIHTYNIHVTNKDIQVAPCHAKADCLLWYCRELSARLQALAAGAVSRMTQERSLQHQIRQLEAELQAVKVCWHLVCCTVPMLCTYSTWFGTPAVRCNPQQLAHLPTVVGCC